jgi:hypothetical protein
VVDIKYILAKVVTDVLYVNCNGDVTEIQFLNVDEKFIADVFKSNNVDGTLDNDVQLLKQDVNSVANVFVSNRPVGIDVIGVDANAFEKVVTFGE